MNRNQKIIPFLFFTIAAAAMLLMSGCSTSNALAEPIEILNPTLTPFQPVAALTPTPTPTPTRRVVTLEPYPTATPFSFATLAALAPYSMLGDTNPLTGQSPNSPEYLNRRPMVVKVANYPRYVRPQSGLSRADIIYEYYIEDDLTRFSAVFYGNDATQVGPVRSGRFFDEHLARMYQGYLVFSGADARVLDHFKNSAIADLMVTAYYCPPLCYVNREIERYNSLFFSTTTFQDFLSRKEWDNTRPDIQPGFFYALPQWTDRTGTRIFTTYSPDSYNYWDYDAGRQQYVRYQETTSTRNEKPPSYAPLVDGLTGLPIVTDNLAVLFVPHTFANEFNKEDEVYHIDLLGSGRAFYFRDGKAYEGAWHRFDLNQPIVLTDLSGNPLALKTGKTFYQVLSDRSSYAEWEGDWFFEHHSEIEHDSESDGAFTRIIKPHSPEN